MHIHAKQATGTDKPVRFFNISRRSDTWFNVWELMVDPTIDDLGEYKNDPTLEMPFYYRKRWVVVQVYPDRGMAMEYVEANQVLPPNMKRNFH